VASDVGVAEEGEDPWLCAPGFRRVSLCRAGVAYLIHTLQQAERQTRSRLASHHKSAGTPATAMLLHPSATDT